jgi:arabinofuranosyltransferase
LAFPIVAFSWGAWNRRWMSDDGYIYLRVVDQLLAGNGPVFNRGERVEAATSPLWVGLLAISNSVLRPVPSPWLAVALGLGLSLTG